MRNWKGQIKGRERAEFCAVGKTLGCGCYKEQIQLGTVSLEFILITKNIRKCTSFNVLFCANRLSPQIFEINI